MLDSAIIGTTCILKAIKKNAPSVKTVVAMSSYATFVDPNYKPDIFSQRKTSTPPSKTSLEERLQRLQSQQALPRDSCLGLRREGEI